MPSRSTVMQPDPNRPELTEADIVRARILTLEPGVLGRDYEFVDGTHHVAAITPEDWPVLHELDARGLLQWWVNGPD